jgi:MFS family permease
MPIRAIARVYREAFSGLPREVWLLSLAALVNRAGTMVLPFFSLFLTQDRGLSILVAGRLISLYGIGSIFGSYLGGWLSDRLGSLRTQQVSLVVSGVGYLIITQVDDLLLLSAVIFLVSVIAEAFRPAVMTAVAEHAPEGLQARAFALLRLAVNLGFAFGPALAGLLALYSYDWLFVGDALTCWIAAGLLVLVPAGGRTAAADRDAAAAGAIRSPWSDGPFLLLMLIVGGLAVSFFQVFSTLPIYLRADYGLREDSIGLLLAFNASLIVAFEMVLIHWAERQNRMLLVAVGCLLVCGGLALLPLGATIPLAALAIGIFTIGEMLSLPLMNAVVADRAVPGNRGRYMGMYTMAFSAAFVFAPITGTWVFEQYGGRALWFGVGALGIPLFLGSLALIGPFRKKALPTSEQTVAAEPET